MEMEINSCKTNLPSARRAAMTYIQQHTCRIVPLEGNADKKNSQSKIRKS